MFKAGEVAPRITLGIFCLAMLGLRTAMAWSVALAPDEAYYWQWSLSPALSYSDHPPLTAWLIWVGTHVAGYRAFGVRLFSVLSSIVAILLVHRLARETGCDERESTVAAMLSSLLLAPGAAALIMTPDTPLGITWLFIALILTKLLKGATGRWWYLLGGALGAALLSKHTGLLAWIWCGLVVLRSPGLRSAFRTIHPWIGGCIAMVVVAPYAIGEVISGGASVRLQIAHLAGRLGGGVETGGMALLERFSGVVAGQLGLQTPPVAIWALWRAVVTGLSPAERALSHGFWIPIAVTLVSAVFTHPEQNWASLGHPLAAVLAVRMLSTRYDSEKPERRRIGRYWLMGLMATVLVFFLAVHVHVVRPFLPLPPERDPVSRLHGWDHLRALAPLVDDVDAVVCDNYGLAAQVAWQLRDGPEVPSVYGVDRGALPSPGSWLLLDEVADWGRADLQVSCDRVTSLEPLRATRRDGAVVRMIRVSKGAGCRAVR